MTKEEHEARAMLLGMTYQKDGHYYVTLPERGPFQRYDADTLELIKIEELVRRKLGQRDDD